MIILSALLVFFEGNLPVTMACWYWNCQNDHAETFHTLKLNNQHTLSDIQSLENVGDQFNVGYLGMVKAAFLRKHLPSMCCPFPSKDSDGGDHLHI